MKKLIFLVAVLGMVGLSSCNNCVKCTVVYTEDSGNSNFGEEHTNEVCDDDVTIAEQEAMMRDWEEIGHIESGWSCK